jgi:hypothetical protein
VRTAIGKTLIGGNPGGGRKAHLTARSPYRGIVRPDEPPYRDFTMAENWITYTGIAATGAGGRDRP